MAVRANTLGAWNLGHGNRLQVDLKPLRLGRQEADCRLAANHGMIASFSRALTEGLSVHQSDEEFDAILKHSIESILEASLT